MVEILMFEEESLAGDIYDFVKINKEQIWEQ